MIVMALAAYIAAGAVAVKVAMDSSEGIVLPGFMMPAVMACLYICQVPAKKTGEEEEEC